VHIKDRPGHDRRYAINSNKIVSELGWSPTESFETGIQKTVEWYINNPLWVSNVQSGNYRNWLAKQYGNKSIRILLTGKNGQVGYELRRSLSVLGEVLAFGSQDYDLSDISSIKEMTRITRPDVIVNSAAYTSVDKAREG